MENKNFAHMKPGEPVFGCVTECTRLNVRANPEKDADVLGTIPADTKVMIDESESTDEFYKICSEVGLEGFCMKQFISVQ